MESKRFQLNKSDLIKIGYVLLWSLGSALIAQIILVIQNLNVPVEYTFLIPIVNTLLVALKKFLEDKGKLI